MPRGRVLADWAGPALLADGGFFSRQLGLALGCVTLADAVALLRRDREVARV